MVKKIQIINDRDTISILYSSNRLNIYYSFFVSKSFLG